ncbi:tripartite motif-containing protein 12A-like [Corythoichthys intestinalis]|uniref:tripartite motif-containing protein 12A-like n=1 Tax=Corythoichthys intestinalis TaxID=161448 RepID=UPI0025A4D99D|nr:tripartite motif-containing protein 12A-like [Corythoichthys intestinalis]
MVFAMSPSVAAHSYLVLQSVQCLSVLQMCVPDVGMGPSLERLQLDIPNLLSETNAVFSKTMAERIKDYHRCPGCTNILRDPLILLCDHNICRTCLQESIAKERLLCQLCGTVFGLSDPRPNAALKAVCEDLSQSIDMCSLHKEELNLFCLDHQELVCYKCSNAEIHRGHRFRPLKEIVKDYHKELQEGLQKAEERVKDARYRKDILIEQAEYIKAQRAKVERKIRKEFKGIRFILDLEKDSRLSAVKFEEEGKTRAIREQIAVLSKQINVLSDVVSSTRKQLKSDNVSFMKNFETAMSRIQELPEMPHLLLEGLLDEDKHVGNLRFKVWEWMKDSLTYIPVILDPNTANPRIYLSQDLNSPSLEEVGQEHPKNPERFQTNLSVLGGALDPGRHVWDVEACS